LTRCANRCRSGVDAEDDRTDPGVSGLRVAGSATEAASFSRLAASGLRGPDLVGAVDFRDATNGSRACDATADVIEELSSADLGAALRDVMEEESFVELLDETQQTESFEELVREISGESAGTEDGVDFERTFKIWGSRS
jgi:hypothetical protein